MFSIYRSLVLVIAGATQKELARQIRYLKVENEILRSKLPARITITQNERQRLVKFGAKLGKALYQLVTIVTPGTFLRWIREEKKGTKRRRRGRRTHEQIRQLIIRMAKENDWGYARIVGELKKLGIHSISKTTVRNILKAKGLEPCPKRAGSTWDEFLKRHADTLWQADFLTQKVLTWKGIRDAYFLVFLHVQTRRVILSPATLHPEKVWVLEQARSFAKKARSTGLKVRFVQHDQDSKFHNEFDRVLQRHHIKGIRSPKCAPNCQAFVERFLGSIRREVLNHFVFFGTSHLDSVAACWLEHYHEERPHQGRGNKLLLKSKEVDCRPDGDVELTNPLGEIRCDRRLGGLLKSYRVAA